MSSLPASAPIEVQIPQEVEQVSAGAVRPFAGYQDAAAWLEKRINVETAKPGSVNREVFKLDRMAALMEALGAPHQAVKTVHVAGSKGKGSVVEMTAACLMGCGLTVGVYTSPHLVHVRERIRIGTEAISYQHFVHAISHVAGAAGDVEAKFGPLTYFEILTAMAFVHFAEQAVDIAVIETGLGGRLDSTNVITPEVSAVTAIQLEHTSFLGETLAKIAREKAGIFKPGIVALSAPQPDEVVGVFEEVARSVGAPFRLLGRDVEYTERFEASPGRGPRGWVSIGTHRGAFEHVAVPLKGEHQSANCGLALAILDALGERGFDLPVMKVIEGLATASHAGRMEMVWHDPRVLLDGAHNPESIQCLVRAVGSHYKYDSLVVIFGCCADKDVDGMLSRIAVGADKIIFTRTSGHARAAKPSDLQHRFSEFSGKMALAADDLPSALALASRAVGPDDLICITGSLYLVGEAKKYLQDKAAGKGGRRR